MQPSTLIALFAAFVPFAAAACCHSTDGKCGDGTDGTPYCGYGPCDIFGCNCEGGCRSSSAASAGGIEVTPSKNTELAPADAFDAANVDGSGNLTLHQFTDYIGSSDDDKATSDFFKKLDKNGDGVLTLEEVLGQ